MKKITLIAMALVCAFGAFACQKTETHPSNPRPINHVQKKWHCAMHPQIIRDEAGDCPICGMQLVVIAGDDSPSNPTRQGQSPLFTLSPAQIQKSAVQIGSVEYTTMNLEAEGYGKVVLDESQLWSIPLRVGGYVQKLKIKGSGQSVKSGDILAEIYSPEWSNAVTELLLLNNQSQSNGNIATNQGIQRLRTLGIDEITLRDLWHLKRTPLSLPVRAPHRGVVLEKSVIEGQSISPGMELFKIANLNHLWVEGEFPQNSLDLFNRPVGIQMRLESHPNQIIPLKILTILPQLGEPNKSVRVRFALNNPSGRIRLGQTAKIQVTERQSPKVLSVPQQSIIPTGKRFIAIKSLGHGQFQTQEIIPGNTIEGRTEILQGLKMGDSIVLSSQFLLDGESHLRAAIQALGQQ